MAYSQFNCAAVREPGVYAFIVAGGVEFIGLTQRGLRGRMDHYVRGHSRQRASARQGPVPGRVAEGPKVEVPIAMPKSTEWNGLPVLTAWS